MFRIAAVHKNVFIYLGTDVAYCVYIAKLKQLSDANIQADWRHCGAPHDIFSGVQLQTQKERRRAMWVPSRLQLNFSSYITWKPVLYNPFPSCLFHSLQPTRSLLPFHRLLHTGAPHRQTAPPRGHQVPPQVFLHGQRHERSHDARTLLLGGQQRGLGWRRKQSQQSETLKVLQASSESPEGVLVILEGEL